MMTDNGGGGWLTFHMSLLNLDLEVRDQGNQTYSMRNIQHPGISEDREGQVASTLKWLLRAEINTSL